MGCYRHLSMDERERILCMQKDGESMRAIGKTLGRSASTISRELKRCKGVYSILVAQRDYRKNKRRCGRKNVLGTDVAQYKQIEGLLARYLSPEQIVGRMRYEGYACVSYGTIYRAIAAGMLPKDTLRIKGRRYRKGRGGNTGHFATEHSIHDRPEGTREQCGHWEADTVLGARNSGAIGSCVERKSRYVKLVKLKHKRSEELNRALIGVFQRMPTEKCRSMTVDNGKEFSGYKALEDALGMRVYFCDPGRPEQRGTNENTNGLLRQFFPKLTSFSGITQQRLTQVEQLLNLRPRKCLGFLTPFEAFHGLVLHLI